MRQWVYVISVPPESRRAGGLSGVVKVGISTNPAGRARTLWQEYGGRHRVIDEVYCGCLARDVELLTHTALKRAGFVHPLIHGEYFCGISPYAVGDLIRQLLQLYYPLTLD